METHVRWQFGRPQVDRPLGRASVRIVRALRRLHAHPVATSMILTSRHHEAPPACDPRLSAHERAACPPVALGRSLSRLSVHDMADSSGELVAVGIMEYHSRGGGPRLIQEWARGARVSASNTRVDGTCGQAGLVSVWPYRHHVADDGASATTPRRLFPMTKTRSALRRVVRREFLQKLW